jgi:hypothetical protein
MSDVPLNMESAERKLSLAAWGFQCACDLCSSPSETKISDKNRQGIQLMLGALRNPEEYGREKLGRISQELLRLAEAESLESQTGFYCNAIMAAYFKLGEYGIAREYAECAVEKLTRFAGPDHLDTREAEKVLISLSRVVSL